MGSLQHKRSRTSKCFTWNICSKSFRLKELLLYLLFWGGYVSPAERWRFHTYSLGLTGSRGRSSTRVFAVPKTPFFYLLLRGSGYACLRPWAIPQRGTAALQGSFWEKELSQSDWGIVHTERSDQPNCNTLLNLKAYSCHCEGADMRVCDRGNPSKRNSRSPRLLLGKGAFAKRLRNCTYGAQRPTEL